MTYYFSPTETQIREARTLDPTGRRSTDELHKMLIRRNALQALMRAGDRPTSSLLAQVLVAVLEQLGTD